MYCIFHRKFDRKNSWKPWHWEKIRRKAQKWQTDVLYIKYWISRNENPFFSVKIFDEIVDIQYIGLTLLSFSANFLSQCYGFSWGFSCPIFRWNIQYIKWTRWSVIYSTWCFWPFHRKLDGESDNPLVNVTNVVHSQGIVFFCVSRTSFAKLAGQRVFLKIFLNLKSANKWLPRVISLPWSPRCA